MLFLLIGVLVLVLAAARIGAWSHKRSRPFVEVGPSHDGTKLVQNMMSARIMHHGRAILMKRVDMTSDDCDEQLAEAVAEMKQKLRTIKAAQRIAGGR